VPQVLTQPLTEDEVRQVLAAIQQRTGEAVRNYAINLLFLNTGIRLSELVHLKISDTLFSGFEEVTARQSICHRPDQNRMAGKIKPC